MAETPALSPSSAPAPSSAPSDSQGESPELSDLLKQYPNLTKTENGQRIKCRFTGHEMAVTVKAVRQYIEGKKYAKFKKNPAVNATSVEQFLKPVVTPGSGKRSKKKKGDGGVEHGSSRGGRGGFRGGRGGRGGAVGGGQAEGGKNADNHKQLYCELTQRLINRDPTHVAKHVQGYRFLREKFRYDVCQRKGIPYVGIVRSKQKNMKRHEDDDEEEDDVDEALEKEKKFSTNPEISDSEDDDNDEKDDDLQDLYPPEDFKEEESDDKYEFEGEGDQKKADAIDSSYEEEEDEDDELFPDSTSSEEDEGQETSSKPEFKGVPFKTQSPPKRKLANGKSFEKKYKKKRVA